jgi:hypothetical protein
VGAAAANAVAVKRGSVGAGAWAGTETVRVQVVVVVWTEPRGVRWRTGLQQCRLLGDAKCPGRLSEDVSVLTSQHNWGPFSGRTFSIDSGLRMRRSLSETKRASAVFAVAAPIAHP